jgi:hypothetical protein
MGMFRGPIVHWIFPEAGIFPIKSAAQWSRP